MNKFYTAIGRFQVKGRLQGTRCPQVVIGHQEYILDMQEMLLWSILNWRILEPDELQTHYEAKERETGFLSHRPKDLSNENNHNRAGAAEAPADTNGTAGTCLPFDRTGCVSVLKG